jgi:SAM-dependent methyltransferase
MEWVADHAPDVPGHVVDIGGRDVNGTVRALFPDADSYTSIDLQPGFAVDVVGDFVEWDPPHSVDTVICCEVLEHAPEWERIVRHAFDILNPGGTLILTCATDGRAPHSGIHGGSLFPGEHYYNIPAAELADCVEDAGFVKCRMDVIEADGDVRLVATHP